MSEPQFKSIATAVELRFNQLSTQQLFVVDISKDELWESYLKSFPEGTNPLFRERTEHDCQCCKQFIRAVGNVIAINAEGQILTIWDTTADGYYQDVMRRMSLLIRDCPIKNVFKHYTKHVGTRQTATLKEGTTQAEVYNHFYCQIPRKHLMPEDDIATSLGDTQANFSTLERSLVELTLDSAETVLELIAQGSIYRGSEHKAILDLFVTVKQQYDALLSWGAKHVFVWKASVDLGHAGRLRNTVIGSLLIDISAGKDLEQSVKSFEAKVAPDNYKRPKALVTPSMIKAAEKKVVDLGYESSLQRRYAKTSDITINNVLFADRSTQSIMKKPDGVFDQLLKSAEGQSPKNYDKAVTIGIEDFLNKVVPTAESIEILCENSLTNNLFSLIAPSDNHSKNMLKWDNNFSWSYNGEVADSMKQRVKAAGGSITGDLRCSLSWCSHNDLDIHVLEPNGNLIYFSNKRSTYTQGTLDIDDTRGGSIKKPAVENITWADKASLHEGRYVVLVHNFSGSNTNESGFELEMEFAGKITHIKYDKAVRHGEKIACILFDYTHKGGVVIADSLPSSSGSKEVWGIQTETFNRVNMALLSPNHWDSNETGNKHYFFVLDKCNTGGKGRGFYNEFLKEELTPNRKVFEVLGGKLQAPESDEQLSGLGFSSTVRSEAVFRVTGKTTRTMKVLF